MNIDFDNTKNISKSKNIDNSDLDQSKKKSKSETESKVSDTSSDDIKEIVDQA